MNRVSLVSWYANIKILLHSNDDKWFCNITGHSGSYSQTETHKCYCDTDPFPDLCLVPLWKNVNVRLKRAGLDDSFVSAGQKQRQNTDEGREQLLIPARGKLQPCSLLSLGPLIHIHIHVTHGTALCMHNTVHEREWRKLKIAASLVHLKRFYPKGFDQRRFNATKTKEAIQEFLYCLFKITHTV